jgi:hypothetical protein
MHPTVQRREPSRVCLKDRVGLLVMGIISMACDKSSCQSLKETAKTSDNVGRPFSPSPKVWDVYEFSEKPNVGLDSLDSRPLAALALRVYTPLDASVVVPHQPISTTSRGVTGRLSGISL